MTDMSELEDESFDVVLDMAAMDALLSAEGDVWHPYPTLAGDFGTPHVSTYFPYPSTST